MRHSVQPTFRGRVLATVGGSYRIGGFFGPLFGGTLAQQLGFRAVFVLQATVSCLSLPFANRGMPDLKPERAGDSRAPSSLWAFIQSHRKELALGYMATLLLSAIRSVRDLLLPLAAQQAGLSKADTGYLTAASYAADVVLFPLGGWLMDRVGLWCAGASASGLMAVGFHLLGATTGAAATLDSSSSKRYAAAVVAGCGNGLSSGIVMALASVGSPDGGLAGPLIASYQFTAAIAGVLSPLIVAEIIQHGSLAAGCTASVAAALASALWWAVLLPRVAAQASEPTKAAVVELARVGDGSEGMNDEQ